MKHGILIASMQGVHNEYLKVIQRGIEENDYMHIIISGSNRGGEEDSPLDIITRESLVKGMIKELPMNDRGKVKIHNIKDIDEISDVRILGNYIYYNLVNIVGCQEFTIYSYESKDFFEMVFTEEIQSMMNVIYIEFSKEVNEGAVINAIKNNDKKYIKENCPKEVIERLFALKSIIKKVYK